MCVHVFSASEHARTEGGQRRKIWLARETTPNTCNLVSATVASSYCFSASHQLANGQKVHQLLLLVEVGAVVVACLPLPLLQPLLGAPLPQSQAEEAPLTVEGGASSGGATIRTYNQSSPYEAWY